MTTPSQHPVLTLLPAQRLFMESIESELLYSGAFGAGKSRILCEKVLFLCLKYAGNSALICRKRFNDLRYTTLVSWEDEVLPPALKEMAGYKHDKTENTFTLPNGSVIYFRGLDDPTKLGSMNLGVIGVDEAIELDEDDWIMLNGRLRLNVVPFRQIFGATNPGSPQHFLYRKFYLDNDPDCLVVESNSLENHHNPEDYRRRLGKNTGKYKDRFVLGKWVGFEGQIYTMFDPPVHGVTP